MLSKLENKQHCLFSFQSYIAIFNPAGAFFGKPLHQTFADVGDLLIGAFDAPGQPVNLALLEGGEHTLLEVWKASQDTPLILLAASEHQGHYHHQEKVREHCSSDYPIRIGGSTSKIGHHRCGDNKHCREKNF